MSLVFRFAKQIPVLFVKHLFFIGKIALKVGRKFNHNPIYFTNTATLSIFPPFPENKAAFAGKCYLPTGHKPCSGRQMNVLFRSVRQNLPRNAL